MKLNRFIDGLLGVVQVLVDENSSAARLAHIKDVAEVDPTQRLGAVQSHPTTRKVVLCQSGALEKIDGQI